MYGTKIFTDRNIETNDLLKYYHLYYYFKLVIEFNNLDDKHFLINKQKSEISLICCEKNKLYHKNTIKEREILAIYHTYSTLPVNNFLAKRAVLSFHTLQQIGNCQLAQ